MTVNAHLRSIWRYRRTVAVVSVVAGVVVFLLASILLSKVYEASAQISVTIPNTSSGQSVDQASVLFASNTYAQLGRTTPVLTAAAQRSGLDIDHQTAASRTTVTPSQTVGVITVTAKGPSPAAAVALASSLSQAVIITSNAQQRQSDAAQLAPIKTQIAQLRTQIDGLSSTSATFSADETELQTLTQQLAQADEAQSSPVSPKTATDAILAFLTALILSAELSAFWSFFHDGFSIDGIEEEVPRVLGLPVLALVPRGPRSVVDDAFRELRTNLIFLHSPQPTKKIAILGVERGVGRTFCAIQLSRSVSEMDATAGLIDADLRQRSVAKALGLPQVPGLTDGLEDPAHLRTHRLPGEGRITVLTAGHPVTDPAGLVGGRIASVVFPHFASAELVIIDTPAAGSHPDALAIAPLCNATLLVIDPKTSRRRASQRLLERLRQVGANPVGVIVNRSDAEGWAPRWRLGRRPAAAPRTTPAAVRVPTTTNGGTPNGDTAGSDPQPSQVR
jgi:Mrp family chromosome partitioning ATPase/capsular polysaccharide biosynthesis protein